MRIVMNNQENDSQTPNNSSDSVQEAAISVGVGAAVGAGGLGGALGGVADLRAIAASGDGDKTLDGENKGLSIMRASSSFESCAFGRLHGRPPNKLPALLELAELQDVLAFCSEGLKDDHGKCFHRLLL
jgi:hypothetical protein